MLSYYYDLSTTAPDDLPPNGFVKIHYNQITGQVECRDWQDLRVPFDGEGGTPFQVVDNLTSFSTNSALSANQGRVLKNLVDGRVPLAINTVLGVSDYVPSFTSSTPFYGDAEPLNALINTTFKATGTSPQSWSTDGLPVGSPGNRILVRRPPDSPLYLETEVGGLNNAAYIASDINASNPQTATWVKSDPDVNGDVSFSPATVFRPGQLVTDTPTDDNYLVKPNGSLLKIPKETYYTAAGPPTVGDHKVGDIALTASGESWTCVQAGSPGVWNMPNQNAFSPKGHAPQKGDWAGIKNYPGIIGPEFNFINDRIYAVPYPLEENTAIGGFSFHVTEVSGSTTGVVRVAVYDDFQGFPGKLLGVTNPASAGTTGTKDALFDDPIPGGRWVWIAFLLSDVPDVSPKFATLKWGPYQLQTGGVLPYYSGEYDGSAPWVYYFDHTGDDFPVRWPIYKNVMLAENEFPLLAIRYVSNSQSNDPRRYEPDRYPVILPLNNEIEENVCQEPCAAYSVNSDPSRRYVLWFSVGGIDTSPQQICWADAPSVDGPWTRRGYFGTGGRGNVYEEDGVLYHYTSASNDGTPGGPIVCRSGNTPEEVAAATPVNALAGVPASGPGSTIGYPYQNTYVIKIGANDYRMFFESQDAITNPGIWASGMAQATAPQGPYTITHWPLDSIRQTIVPYHAGMYAPGSVYWDGSQYVLIYHGADSGNLPTEVFRATSDDLVNWTPDPLWLVRREHAYEYDQIADPFRFVDPETGKVYLFWSALDNTEGRFFAAIMRSNPNKLVIT